MYSPTGLMYFTLPPRPANSRGEVEALALMRTLRVVDPVVREIRNDLAGDDPVQRVRTVDAAEFQRSRSNPCDAVLKVCNEESSNRVGDADALERPLDRIAQRGGETGAGLRVVLQIGLVARRQVDRLVQLLLGQRRLVVVVAAVVHRPAELQRAIEQVRLGERQVLVALILADLELQASGSRLCRTGCWWCS